MRLLARVSGLGQPRRLLLRVTPMQTKTCPHCLSDDIHIDARKCRHCSEWLDVNEGKRHIHDNYSFPQKIKEFLVSNKEPIFIIVILAAFALIFIHFDVWAKISSNEITKSQTSTFDCDFEKNSEDLAQFVKGCNDKENGKITLEDGKGKMLMILDKKKVITSCQTDCVKNLDQSDKKYVEANNLNNAGKTVDIIFAQKPNDSEMQKIVKDIFSKYEFHFNDRVRVNIANTSYDPLEMVYKFPELSLDIVNNTKSSEKVVYFSISNPKKNDQVLTIDLGLDNKTKPIHSLDDFNTTLSTYLQPIVANNESISLSDFLNSELVSVKAKNIKNANLIFVANTSIIFPTITHGYNVDENSCRRWHQVVTNNHALVENRYQACLKTGNKQCSRSGLYTWNYDQYYLPVANRNLNLVQLDRSNNVTVNVVSYHDYKFSDPECKKELNAITDTIFSPLN